MNNERPDLGSNNFAKKLTGVNQSLGLSFAEHYQVYSPSPRGARPAGWDQWNTGLYQRYSRAAAGEILA